MTNNRVNHNNVMNLDFLQWKFDPNFCISQQIERGLLPLKINSTNFQDFQHFSLFFINFYAKTHVLTQINTKNLNNEMNLDLVQWKFASNFCIVQQIERGLLLPMIIYTNFQDIFF